MSTRPDTRPHSKGPIRVPHPARPRTAASPLACAARAAATVAGLRIDPDGHLVEVAVPLRATAWALAGFTDTDRGPAGIEALHLDRDLICWTGEPGVGVHNPVASIAAAMFGCPGPIHGPVVLTGWAAEPGLPRRVDHIGVAAVILLAGTAASCDLSDRTAERAAEFARLGIHIAAPPVPDQDQAVDRDQRGDHRGESTTGELYDSQRHTVTREGGWPRCAACGEPTVLGHDEHHPDQPTDPGPDGAGR